jgi:hypothetical protein
MENIRNWILDGWERHEFSREMRMGMILTLTWSLEPKEHESMIACWFGVKLDGRWWCCCCCWREGVRVREKRLISFAENEKNDLYSEGVFLILLFEANSNCVLHLSICTCPLIINFVSISGLNLIFFYYLEWGCYRKYNIFGVSVYSLISNFLKY